MSTLRFASKRLALACACIGLCVAAGAQQPGSVVAVEWIPLHADTLVLQAMQDSAQAKGTKAAVERVNVMSEEAELAKAIESIKARAPKAVIGFGDYVCERLVAKCPNTRIVTVFARSHGALARAAKGDVTIINSEPDPVAVVDVVRKLKPDMKRIGIIYTDKFTPNTELAQRLEQELGKSALTLARITVHPGFCRTESDYRQAIAKTHTATPLDTLFVPDDPNSSRFGGTICATATELGIRVIGTDAIAGKGCAATIEPDIEAIGQQAWAAVTSPASENGKPRVVTVPGRVVVRKSFDKTGLMEATDRSGQTLVSPKE